jgi:hypothetical protein
MSQPIKLSISNQPKYLGLIRKFFQGHLNYHEVPGETASRLILYVDERAYTPLLSNKGMEALSRNPLR